MKVPRKAESFYILDSLLELIINIRQFGKKIPSISGNFRSFFSWKILWTGWNHFSLVEIWWKFTSERNPRGTHTWQPWSNLFTAPCFLGMNSFMKVLAKYRIFFFGQIESRPGFLLQFCDMKVLEFCFPAKTSKICWPFHLKTNLSKKFPMFWSQKRQTLLNKNHQSEICSKHSRENIDKFFYCISEVHREINETSWTREPFNKRDIEQVGICIIMSLLSVAASVKFGASHYCSTCMMETRSNLWRNPNILNAAHQRFHKQESWVACTLGKKYIKESFLYHYTNLGKIFDFKLVNSIFFLFGCQQLALAGWHLSGPTGLLFDSASTPFFGAFCHFPTPTMSPCKSWQTAFLVWGVLTTHRHEGLPFCIEDSRICFILLKTVLWLVSDPTIHTI